MSEHDRGEAAMAGERDDAHLADVEDGCGCAEVWEHLSAQRAARERGEMTADQQGCDFSADDD